MHRPASTRATILGLVTLLAPACSAGPAGGAEPAAPSAELVKFEPPGARIYHFAGGSIDQPDVVAEYVAALGPGLHPVGDSFWMDLPGTRGLASSIRLLEIALQREKARGGMLNVTVAFDQGRVDGHFSSAADREVAETSFHDADIDRLAAFLRDSGVPIFLRLGGEVNGPWEGHHPWIFPAAFRKLALRLRALGADNVAVVWCVEPSGDPDIDARDERGAWKWFPGEDVVDWYGIDLFQVRDFGPSETAEDEQTRRRRLCVERLLRMARRAGKPVFVGEASPFQVDVVGPRVDTRGHEGRRDWDAWFAPFVAWLDQNPEVKAVSLCSVDWTKTRVFVEWGDARVHENPELLRRWREELMKPRWIHLHEWTGRPAPPPVREY